MYMNWSDSMHEVNKWNERMLDLQFVFCFPNENSFEWIGQNKEWKKGCEKEKKNTVPKWVFLYSVPTLVAFYSKKIIRQT